jgi:hypothetical protein
MVVVVRPGRHVIPVVHTVGVAVVVVGEVR